MSAASSGREIRRVGFIGLGVLGSAIVPRLLESGFEVTGLDIDRDKVAALAASGMRAAHHPLALAERSDAVILCLPGAAALREVVDGAHGLAQGDGAGQVVIEISTLPVDDKESARSRLAGAGRVLLDCPVSGNRIHARRGELTVFMSGAPDACRRVEPVLLGFARACHYVGEFGCGMKMKIVGNILNLVHNAAAAEVMVLGMKSGLDPALIHRVISGSASSSSMFEVRGALMARNDYRHEGMNFSIPLKDARIISAHAADLRVPLPVYHAALQLYYAAVAQGHHDEDAAAVCAAAERAASFERPK